MSKLYATATSEKASKGQGGNDWLDVKLTIKEDNIMTEIGILRLQPHILGYKLILDRSSHYRLKAERVYEEIIETKGKSQKGDERVKPWYCKQCKTVHTTRNSPDGDVWVCEIPF